MIKFDLSTVGLTAAQVASATMTLYSVSPVPLNATAQIPDPTHQIEIAVSPITSTWNRNSVLWVTQPSQRRLVHDVFRRRN